MDERDVAYYRERAVTERHMALEASRADVASIHLEFAKQYQALGDQVELREALTIARPNLNRASCA